MKFENDVEVVSSMKIVMVRFQVLSKDEGDMSNFTEDVKVLRNM